jgi:cytoskeletal protein CcmA (bactofilin family)
MPKNNDITTISDTDITTVLADDIQFNGTIKFKSSLMIKGDFTGEVISEGLLLVGTNAKIKANVKTNTLVSHGNIDGNIEATKSTVLCKSSVLNGDISTPRIFIEDGAIFNGKSTMPIQKNNTPKNNEN